jgi:hypothetical protein
MNASVNAAKVETTKTATLAAQTNTLTTQMNASVNAAKVETTKVATNTATANIALAAIATNTGSLQQGISAIAGTASMILNTIMAGVRVTGNLTATLGAGANPTAKPVHTANAFGPGNGMAFTSMRAAQNWERSMVPGSKRIASITANSGERFGGGAVTNNITINQQPNQNAEELATIVALKIGEAISDARASSIFV